jgi:hypothetical protein
MTTCHLPNAIVDMSHYTSLQIVKPTNEEPSIDDANINMLLVLNKIVILHHNASAANFEARRATDLVYSDH